MLRRAMTTARIMAAAMTACLGFLLQNVLMESNAGMVEKRFARIMA
jgi:hypothetical protein